MYEIKDSEFKAKAMKTFSDLSKEQLIQELCYWRDKYYVASNEAFWLDALADYLRDTSDEDNKENEQLSYREYKDREKLFRKRYND